MERSYLATNAIAHPVSGNRYHERGREGGRNIEIRIAGTDRNGMARNEIQIRCQQYPSLIRFINGWMGEGDIDEGIGTRSRKRRI